MNAFNLLVAAGVTVTITPDEPNALYPTHHPLRLTLTKGDDRVEYQMSYLDPSNFDADEVLQQLVFDSNAAQVPFDQWEHGLTIREARRQHRAIKERGKTLARMVGDMAALTEAVVVHT